MRLPPVAIGLCVALLPLSLGAQSPAKELSEAAPAQRPDAVAAAVAEPGSAGFELKLRLDPELHDPGPARGQPRPLFGRGDQLDGREARDFTLRGEAELRRGGTVIRADRLTYYEADDEVIAIGNVRIAREGQVFTGPQLQLKLDAGTGGFDSPRFSLPLTGGRGSASRIDFKGDGQVDMSDAVYTSCRPDDPDWYLKADTLSLDEASDEGVGKSARLVFMGVPILGSPVFSFPLGEQRRSGVLAPTLSLTSTTGGEIRVPYYWDIAPNRDFTFLPMLMARRGLQLGGIARYLEPTYYGETSFEYLNNDRETGTDRWQVNSTHTLTNWNGWSAGWLLRAVSDDNYFVDFSRTILSSAERSLPRIAYAARSFGEWSFQARALQYQNILDARAAPPYNRLPQLLLSTVRRDQLGFDYGLLSDASWFSRDLPGSPEGGRFIVNPWVSRPFGGPGWFVVPRASFNATYYRLDFNPSGPNDINRTLPTFSLDSGLVMERSTPLSRAGADPDPGAPAVLRLHAVQGPEPDPRLRFGPERPELLDAVHREHLLRRRPDRQREPADARRGVAPDRPGHGGGVAAHGRGAAAVLRAPAGDAAGRSEPHGVALGRAAGRLRRRRRRPLVRRRHDVLAEPGRRAAPERGVALVALGRQAAQPCGALPGAGLRADRPVVAVAGRAPMERSGAHQLLGAAQAAQYHHRSDPGGRSRAARGRCRFRVFCGLLDHAVRGAAVRDRAGPADDRVLRAAGAVRPGADRPGSVGYTPAQHSRVPDPQPAARAALEVLRIRMNRLRDLPAPALLCAVLAVLAVPAGAQLRVPLPGSPGGTGGSGGFQVPRGPESAPLAPGATAPPAAAPGGPVHVDRVVAVVNSEAITDVELQRRARAIARRLKSQGVDMPPASELEKQVLERMIQDRAQLQAAREAGMRVDELSSTVRSAAWPTRTSDRRAAAQPGSSSTETPYAAFREEIAQEIAVSRLRERDIDAKVQVSEAEIDAFLAEQAKGGGGARSYDIAQIVVRVPDGRLARRRSSASACAARRSRRGS